MRRVEYHDLYQFHLLSNVVFSPDGTHAVFTDNRPSEEKNGYLSDLWLLELSGRICRKLTGCGTAKNAFWLDNQTVIFSSNREKKEKISQWYRIPIDGGEAEAFLEIEETVVSLVPVCDGTFAAVVSRDCEDAAGSDVQETAGKDDCVIFDEIPFWYDGQGVRNKVRNAVMLIRTGEKTVITSPYMKVTGMCASPDGSGIVYSGTEFKDVLQRSSGLYHYDIASGQTRTLVAPGEMAVGDICFMGEHTIFFTGTTFEFPGKNPRYFLCDLVSGERRLLPFCDAVPGASVGTDCGYGGGNRVTYAGNNLYFSQLHWGNTHLVKMDRNGKREPVYTGAGSFNSFDVFGDIVLMTAMRDTELPELWLIDLRRGEETRLTSFNRRYMETHSVVIPEYFTFKNRDGLELDGYVLKPVGYVPGARYPAVLEMHGGPKGVFGGVFHHEMQCLANLGYFVFFTNPRGSDGRGEQFANITEQLGGIDYHDFMDFLDEVLSRYPDIDEKRVGACGGSYAGFMCNWMIGHTDRFAAAVSQRSISNYLTKTFCTDIGFYHNIAQLGATPWEDFDVIWDHSPLKYAPNAKTPTLFIHSDEDYRCWMSESFQMFTALKMNGADSRIALFHGESHGLSRTGKPKNRIYRLKEIIDWFETYLKE